MKSILKWIFILGCIGGVIYLWQNPDKIPEGVRHQQKNLYDIIFKEAPEIDTIVLNGEKVELKDHLVEGSVTLFYFYMDRNAPCKRLTPSLETIAKSSPHLFLRKIHIKNINTPVAKQYRIKFVPSVWIYDTIGDKAASGLKDPELIRSKATGLIPEKYK